MPDLAVLHTTLAQKLDDLGDATRYLRPVCVTSSVDVLDSRLDTTSVDAVIADLDLLGDAPRTTIDRLIATGQAELGVITYAFARRTVVRSLEAPHLRLLRSPVSLSVLRSSMAQLVARDIFSRDQPTPKLDALTEKDRLACRSRDLKRILDDIPKLIPADAQALVSPLRSTLTSLSDLKITGTRVVVDTTLRPLITEAERALDSLTQRTQVLRSRRGAHV